MAVSLYWKKLTIVHFWRHGSVGLHLSTLKNSIISTFYYFKDDS